MTLQNVLRFFLSAEKLKDSWNPPSPEYNYGYLLALSDIFPIGTLSSEKHK